MNVRKDWQGETYKIMEETQGDFWDIVYTILYIKSDGTQNLNSFMLSHTQFDGLGALLHILKNYYQIEISPLQLALRLGSYSKQKFSFKHRLELISSFIIESLSGNKRIPWKQYDSNLEKARAGAEFGYYRFECDETKKIYNFNSKKLNGICLFSINKIIKKYMLQHEDYIFPWFITADMRRFILQQDTGNYVGGFLLKNYNDSTTDEINRSIYNKIKNKAYWQMWWFLNLPKYIGKFFTRLLIKYFFHQANGSYVNMGIVNIPNPSDGELIASGSPPVNMRMPLVASVSNVNGQLLLSLRLHPALMKTQEDMHFYCQEWAAQIREEVEKKPA